MKCIYENPAHSCERDALDHSYCILHSDYPISNFDRFSFEFYYLMKIIDEKNQIMQEKISNEDYDFSGAKLIDIDLTGKEIKKDLFFWEAIIYGNVDLSNSIIKGNLGFNGAKICGSFFSTDSELHGTADFKGVNMLKNVVFNKSKITGDINFAMATLEDLFVFRNGNVSGNFIFSPNYVGFVDFRSTTVHQRLEIYGVNFREHIYFDDLKVMEDMYIQDTIFHKEAYFSWIKIFDDARFENVFFYDIADFKKAIFNGAVYFIKTEPNTKEIFGKTVNFNESSFLAKGLFSELIKFEATFEGARLRNVVFRYCNLKNTYFKDVIFENCELSTSELPKTIFEEIELEFEISERLRNLDALFLDILPNFLKVSFSPDFVNSARTISDTYRRIRQCLQNEGAYADAGEFYIKELDMKRNVYYSENRTNWFLFGLLKILSGYGEQPIRLVILIVILIILFIYFKQIDSLATLLQNGDLLIQIVLMPFFMALFVYSFARKMSR
jgi:uncharacterized protein YjbI with pentapeptide repeats